MSEKEAKAFVGSHWTMKIGYCEQKLWVKLDCEQFPMMNLFMSGLEEGKEYTIKEVKIRTLEDTEPHRR